MTTEITKPEVDELQRPLPSGLSLNFLHIDPVRALFWAAILNGVFAAPLMAVTMTMASSQQVTGKFVIPSYLKGMGWVATGVVCLSRGVLYIELSFKKMLADQINTRSGY